MQATADTLRTLIEEQKRTSFQDPSTAPDEAALGILISQFLEWDGIAILNVAADALEDANFHDYAGRLREWAARDSA